MRFEIERTIDSKGEQQLRFRGEVTMRDIAILDLDAMGAGLLENLEDDTVTAADYLLALEMLYRRYVEQHPSKGLLPTARLPP